MTSRDLTAYIHRSIRRIGRNPRYRALEDAVCRWFLILFAAVLLTHLVLAALRGHLVHPVLSIRSMPLAAYCLRLPSASSCGLHCSLLFVSFGGK
jgi:hypothetical protein